MLLDLRSSSLQVTTSIECLLRLGDLAGLPEAELRLILLLLERLFLLGMLLLLGVATMCTFPRFCWWTGRDLVAAH